MMKDCFGQSFQDFVDDELLPGLVRHEGIGFLMVRSDDHGSGSRAEPGVLTRAAFVVSLGRGQ